MKRILAMALLLVLSLVATLPAFSQTWPSRPVKVVVGFPAGTSSDIIARIYAEKLADHFKQGFIVENMVGAASNRAAGAVAAAEGDGYTLLLGTVANTISQSVFKKLKFDFAVDLAPVAALGSAPTVLVVNPSLGIASVRDLITYAKSKPEQVFYASAGVGTAPHLAAEMFNQLASVKLIHVPYKGNSEPIADLLGGRISVIFAPIPTVAELMKSGQVKALAVGSTGRSTLLPDLPTLAESGVSGFDAVIWYGLFVPKATSRPVVDAIAEVANRATGRAEMKAKLAIHGADPLVLTPSELVEFVKGDVAKWKKIVESAGVSVE